MTFSPSSEEFPCKSLAVEQSDAMARMFENETLTDFVQICGGKQIKVAKAVVALRSDVFQAMFENDMIEKKTGQVEIFDVKFEDLRALVKFLYCNIVHESDMTLGLLMVADKYAMCPVLNIVINVTRFKTLRWKRSKRRWSSRRSFKCQAFLQNASRLSGLRKTGRKS